MKNTGVIRKIDELGRIVVPKEIRKNLNIKNGEDLQIYIEDDKIILKKYQKMLTIGENAQNYIDTLIKLSDSKYFVTDKEKVIASSLKNNEEATIDSKVYESMQERKTLSGYGIRFNKEIIDNYYYIIPIIIDADAIGSVIVTNKVEISDKDKLIGNIISLLLISLVS